METWTDWKNEQDKRNRRARHWKALRATRTHYGTGDLVARAALILALLIVGTLAAGCDEGNLVLAWSTSF